MNHLKIIAYFVLIAVASVRPQALEGNSIFTNRPRPQRFPQQNNNGFGFGQNNQGFGQFPNQMQFLQGNGLNQGQNQQFPQLNFGQGLGNGWNNQGFSQNQNQQFPNQVNQGQNQQFSQQNGFGTAGSNNLFSQNSTLQGLNQQQFLQQGQFQPFPQQSGQDPFGVTQGNQQQQPGQNQTTSTTTPDPNSGTTPDQSQTTSSMLFILCNRSCLTTNEYSPVCGSNQVAYPNERRLGCVNRCGRRVNPNWQEITVIKTGTCVGINRVA